MSDDNEISLLVGTSRRPLAAVGPVDPSDPRAPLVALAMASARLLHPRRAAPVASADGPALGPDAGTAMSRGLREALVAEFERTYDEVPARMLAFALRDAGLSIHPLDLVRLRAFVVHQRDVLGGVAKAFADRVAPEGRTDIPHAGWQYEKPEPIGAMFRRLRARDPEAARSVAAAGLHDARPEARVAMLEAFVRGASSADEPLVRPLAAGRSSNTKDAALQVLSAIPGTPEAEETFQATLASILVRRAGGGAAVSSLVQENHHHRSTNWDGGYGGHLRSPLARLAAEIGTDVPGLVAAAVRGTNRVLLTGLARRALIERDFASAAALAEATSARHWNWRDGSLDDLLPDAGDPSLPGFLEAASAADLLGDASNAVNILELHAKHGMPLSERTFDRIMECDPFGPRMHRMQVGFARRLACVAPASRSAELARRLRALPPEDGGRALDTLAVFDAIRREERVSP